MYSKGICYTAQLMQFCASNNGIGWHISCDEATFSIPTFLMCLEEGSMVRFKDGLEDFGFLTQECASSKKGTAAICGVGGGLQEVELWRTGGKRKSCFCYSSVTVTL